MATKIRFNQVGVLPVPCDWMIPPDIKVMPLRQHKSKKPHLVYVYDEAFPNQRTRYSFGFNANAESLKRGVWKNWHGIGWEDLEVGHAWISATYYDFDDPDFEGVSSRVTWFVRFSHDGDPSGEFWGWHVEQASVVHAYNRVPRDKTPITYEYECKNIAGEKVKFQMTGNGEFDSEEKAKKKIDEDPNLRKMQLAGENVWKTDYYFGGVRLVRSKDWNDKEGALSDKYMLEGDDQAYENHDHLIKEEV